MSSSKDWLGSKSRHLFRACTYALFGNGDDENEICALQEHLSPMRDGQVRSAASATAIDSKPGRVTIVTRFFVDGPPHGPYIFRDNGVEL
jgi:hypothetical protein